MNEYAEMAHFFIGCLFFILASMFLIGAGIFLTIVAYKVIKMLINNEGEW